MSKELRLMIKEKFLKDICSGEKTIEYREFSDYYISRLCCVEKNEIVSLKEYETVKFVAGYSKTARTARFKIKSVFIVEYQNDIPEGLEKGDLMFEIEIGERI